MSVTAVVNQKGGVGKTTIALGLASALGSMGRSVLLVDLDPQANATTGLGIWDARLTIDRVLAEDRTSSAEPAVVPAGWDAGSLAEVPCVVPGSPALAQVEHQLVSDVIGAQDRLATALVGLPERFDEVIIDCPPSLGILTVNALFASDRVVVVTEPAAWSSDGVEQILRNCERIAARRGGSPEVAGIVVNRVGRTRDATYWAEQLEESHPDLMLHPHVKSRAAVAEASAQAVPLHALTRSGATEAIAEFDALVEEVFASPAITVPEPDLPDPTVETPDRSEPIIADVSSPGDLPEAPTVENSRERSETSGRAVHLAVALPGLY